jgi:hypothetical protein
MSSGYISLTNLKFIEVLTVPMPSFDFFWGRGVCVLLNALFSVFNYFFVLCEKSCLVHSTNTFNYNKFDIACSLRN